MQTELQIPVDCEVRLTPQNVSIQEGDCHMISPTQNIVESQYPAKKATRQWAAWTRQEEESFFNALRQVGKNFEKITCRVQSKNKDQVRHYYYRLVRRMNKLLGPGLCLDAKNSKDTNAAMLRWWSLLEKFSCKASKLHLKPRRFKIFIEALESQLLKDRKKNIKKQLSHGENCSPCGLSAIPSQSRGTSHINRAVKLVLADSQNIQNLGPGKGLLKRNVNVSANCCNTEDSTAMKPPRQRRKSGVLSSATYKKWEKAAIAGVSLVADAAEHLERTTTFRDIEHGQSDSRQNDFDSIVKVPPHFPNYFQNLCTEKNTQTCMKLKLQLFPLDDTTRIALEMDNHNPYLELTLSTRKKISSVVEHLGRKWGDSRVACGELMLFPYGVQKERLEGIQRWTLDSIATAADVYAIIGSSSVFRLRYGWFANDELGSRESQAPIVFSCMSMVQHHTDMGRANGHIMDSVPTSMPLVNQRAKNFADQCKDQQTSVSEQHASLPSSIDLQSEIAKPVGSDSGNKFVEPCDTVPSTSGKERETINETTTMQPENVDGLRLSNGNTLSAGDWADSPTNVSVGDLLAEVPEDLDANCLSSPDMDYRPCFQQTPFSCDSFDAAIAAHISSQQDKTRLQSNISSHSSSILDGEETCDAFWFQRTAHQVGTSAPGACKSITKTMAVCSVSMEEKLPEVEGSGNSPPHGDPMGVCPSDSQIMCNPPKDFSSLTDLYWSDSLGPLELDIPSPKYHGEGLILSDSLGGLNGLITSSLDAFQNCSLFGADKKDSGSKVESQGPASFSDLKLSTKG